MTDRTPADIIAAAIWPDSDPDVHDANVADVRQALSALAAAGFVVVPIVPTEAQWSGLARDLVMWRDMQFGRDAGGRALYRHLSRIGRDIPDWLRKEIPDTDHVPPKGAVAACIYRAMLAAAPGAGG